MTHIIAKTGAIVLFIHILFSCNLRHNGDGANAIHYKIVYLKDRNIWFMDEDGQNKKQFTTSNNVIAFTHNGNNMYYTEMEGSSLVIYQSLLNSSKPKVPIGKIEGKEENYFTDWDNGVGEIQLLDSNTLVVRGKFSTAGGGFDDTYGFNIAKKKLSYSNLMDDNSGLWDENFIDLNDKNKFTNFQYLPQEGILELNKHADINTSHFFSRKAGAQYELYSYNANKKAIKISTTQKYTQRVCYDEVQTGFNYALTSSNKVVFFFISGCGDFEHGTYFIANMDGTHQQLLVEDGITHLTRFGLLHSNGEIITLSEENLITYTGAENKMQVLANNVKYFELLR